MSQTYGCKHSVTQSSNVGQVIKSVPRLQLTLNLGSRKTINLVQNGTEFHLKFFAVKTIETQVVADLPYLVSVVFLKLLNLNFDLQQERMSRRQIELINFSKGPNNSRGGRIVLKNI